MLDAIDGRRSIAEILDRARASTERGRARVFFERLWWYDPVVFDASKTR